MLRRMSLAAVAAALASGALAGCGSGPPTSARAGTILVVGAENEYASVLSQIGGRWVTVAAIMSNPNTDPHTFEASARVAESVADARLVVQNGLGYDQFMTSLEGASPSSGRRVIDVQHLLGLAGSTPNPHLWYSPRTMPAVAAAVATDLAALAPAHASYFAARRKAFDASLAPWLRELAALRSRWHGAPVATTEPVGDYLLEAAGLDDRTPFGLQADIMNGVDPSPETVGIEDRLLSHHEVDVFVYNRQVTDPLTGSFLAEARRGGVPVVGVYETMPTPGYDYQTWMEAETAALQRALADHTSTGKL